MLGHQTTRGDHSGDHVFKLAELTEEIWLMVYVLIYSAPGFAVFNSVLPRGGPNARSPVVWRRK